ncbi:MAG: secretin N-terminal domain-containing protein [bacterium]
MEAHACTNPSRLRWLSLAMAVSSSLALAAEGDAPAVAVDPGVKLAAPAVDVATNATVVAAAANTSQVISLTLDDVPLAEVVRLFTRISGANIIAATTNLQGQVTANLQDVPWRPAFESILERQSLQLIEKPPASGIFVIEGRKSGEDPRVSTTIKLSYAKVADVSTLVTGILGKDGTSTPFAAGNTIVINASVLKAADVRKIIEELDRPRTQVAIETKIVQLTEGTSKKLGIDWQSLDAYKIRATGQGNYSRNVAGGPVRSTTTTRTYDQFGNEVPQLDHYETITTPSGDISVPIYKATTTALGGNASEVTSLRGLSAVLTPGEFNIVLSMLEGSSGTKLVSNPKIIVANEEKATIKMAQDEPNIKITRARATIQGQEDVITSELDDKRPYFTYGITVEVTPRINTTSNITVTIKPELSTKVTDKVAPDGNVFPIIEKKVVETVFSLSDGRTAAIGGLIQTEDADIQSKVPLLGDIPLLGRWLFQHKSRVKNQKEVLIFVTVTLVEAQTSTRETGLPSESVLYEKNYPLAAPAVVAPAAAVAPAAKAP